MQLRAEEEDRSWISEPAVHNAAMRCSTRSYRTLRGGVELRQESNRKIYDASCVLPIEVLKCFSKPTVE